MGRKDHSKQDALATGARRGVRIRRALLLSTCVIGCLLAAAPVEPRLVWNHTASVPLGLYALEHRDRQRGDLVAVKPDNDLAAGLHEHGVLAGNRLLLKPVAGISGDLACREGDAVTVNGQLVARAADHTSTGRALPRWQGCRRLGAHELFLISDHPGSFDGRYFGPVDARQVLGVARPVITYSPPRAAR